MERNVGIHPFDTAHLDRLSERAAANHQVMRILPPAIESIPSIMGLIWHGSSMDGSQMRNNSDLDFTAITGYAMREDFHLGPDWHKVPSHDIKNASQPVPAAVLFKHKSTDGRTVEIGIWSFAQLVGHLAAAPGSRETIQLLQLSNGKRLTPQSIAEKIAMGHIIYADAERPGIRALQKKVVYAMGLALDNDPKLSPILRYDPVTHAAMTSAIPHS